MNSIRLILAFLFLALLAGCYTLSLHPLYTEKEVIFEQKLLGTWGDPKESDETWTFTQGSRNAYRLVIRNEGLEAADSAPGPGEYSLITEIDPVRDGIFEVHLLKLDGHMFIDIYPEEPEIGNELFKAHVIPAHSFARVKISSDSFSLALFNAGWLEESIKHGRVKIDHTDRDNTVVLTAKTAELQDFILKHIDEAFEEFQTVSRLTE